MDIWFSLALATMVGAEGVFLSNAMAGRKRLNGTDLKEMVGEGLPGHCNDVLRGYVLSDLLHSPEARRDLSRSIQAYSAEMLQSKGVAVLRVDNLRVEKHG